MKIGIFYFLLLVISSNPLFSQGFDCQASLKGDELIVSNGLVSFFYQWNRGNIKLDGYQLNGKNAIRALQAEEDLKLFADSPAAENAKLTTTKKTRFAGEREFLEVSISFDLGGIKVRRILEIFPNTPAINSFYYVKGSAAANWIDLKSKHDGNLLIEEPSLLEKKAARPRLGYLPLAGRHWTARTVSFQDATDHHNTLVFENDYLPYVKPVQIRANILLLNNSLTNTGLFLLKESPLGDHQQGYPGADFSISTSGIEVLGTGIDKNYMNDEQWQRSYGYVVGLSDADQTAQLLALKTYQKTIRSLKAGRDEMLMSNTWGDRSKDSRMNEEFILRELEAAGKLGITHFQLDDGWQNGLSANSAQKEGKKWDSWSKEDWKPHHKRFPNGLRVIAERAKSLNIKLGLWFNPGSGNDYQNWERDAQILADYYHRDGIMAFKIDGVELKNKKAEENLRRFFDSVIAKTGGKITFNLDVTAGRRPGYHYFNEYGNVFLENRYTDWANYYPHATLRNLWMLSKYVPTEKLQVEWLNKWRNADKYGTDDVLAPSNIPWNYLTATTFMAQPLAWMEVSGLPEEGFKVAGLIGKYKELQHEIHQGAILPIGEVPNGFSWTGFQSVKEKGGFFMVFREQSPLKKRAIRTYLKPNQKIKLTSLINQQDTIITQTSDLAEINFKLNDVFSFEIFSYEILDR